MAAREDTAAEEPLDDDIFGVGADDDAADPNDIVDEEFAGLTDADVDAEGDTGEDLVEAGDEALDDDLGEGDEQGTQPRDGKGRFAPKGEEASAAKDGAAAVKPAAGAKPDATKDGTKPDAKLDATPDAAAGAAAVETAPASKPEPLAVRVDKALVPIDEVQMVKANGHVFLSIKDADFAKFNNRLVRGIAAERMWRDLQTGLKELELQKSAPQPKSDAEVEASILLEALKPMLPDILSEQQLENLELKVKLAQRTAREDFTKAEQTRRDEATKAEREQTAAAEEDKAVFTAIADEVLSVIEAHPELQKLSPDDIKAVYGELVPLRRSILWKENNQWFKDNQLILDRLRARARGTAASSPAPSQEPHAGGATTASTSKPGDKPDKPDAADRFNRGQDSAAKPTTSLKAKRGTPAASRPRDERHHRDPGTGRAARRDMKTPAMIAEDKSRATQRKYLNSPSLDFEDDEDED